MKTLAGVVMASLLIILATSILNSLRESHELSQLWDAAAHGSTVGAENHCP